MSVPKKRQNRRKKGTRASHHGLDKTGLTTCPKCKQPVRPHTVCQNCGYYKGRNVLKLEEKMTKKQKKEAKKKEEKEAKEAPPAELDEMGNPIK